MNGWDRSAITIATFLPVAGAVVIALMPRQQDRLIRWTGVLVTGAAMVIAVAIAIGFDYGTSGLQFEQNTSWISAIGARCIERQPRL